MALLRRQRDAVAIRNIRASRSHAFRAGVIAIVLVVIGTFFAFRGAVPFQDHYEVKAMFETSNNVKQHQPVRIAGVQVGEVVKVEHKGEQALVTLRIEDEGRPLHKDAVVKIRPRLFLEGNWFIDLEPGTPSAGELADDGVIPIQQTKTPVQFGQVLNSLNSDVRESIRTVFKEYGQSLRGAGARGYRRSIPYWEPAYKNQAIVQQASLGQELHDLSEYIDGAGRVARGLDRHPEALKSLVTDFNAAAGAFAREAGALEVAIGELPRTLRAAQPALDALNDALPPLRRFARDLRPSIVEQGKTIDVAFPFLQQSRRLVSREELRGLVADLRPTVPALARLTEGTIPLYEQLRLAASCENDVVLPFAQDRVGDPNFPATGIVAEEAPKSLVGVAGESRSGDANGQWFRVLTSAGDHTISMGNGTFAQAYLPIQGTNPPKPAQGRFPTYDNEDVPCETQEPPDLRSTPGPGEPTISRGLPAGAQPRYQRSKTRALRWVKRTLKAEDLEGEFRVTSHEPSLRELREMRP